MDNSHCPRCRSAVPSLVDVRPETQNYLIMHQSGDGLFKKVCSACLQVLEDGVRDASLIQNRMSSSELAKVQAWGRRMDVLKEALSAMKNEKFEEALGKYKEYMRIIEIVLGMPSKAITAQAFAFNSKAEEMPIYALVLWDLIVCNDGKDEAAQQEAATKMIQLVKGTSLRKTLKDRAKKYLKTAKNKKFIKKLLKDFQSERACYVATFAYGSVDHHKVEYFRNYRDQILQESSLGRGFIRTYYFLSPMVVQILKRVPYAQQASRFLLDRLARVLRKQNQRK